MPDQLRFQVSRTVCAPTEAIWHVLGDFGTEHQWTKTVDHCARDTDAVRVGTVRACTLAVIDELEVFVRASTNTRA